MARATTGLSYLILSLVLLGSLIFTVFVTVPQWSVYRNTQKSLERLNEKRAERSQFLASIDARKKELKGYARDVLALSVALPERVRSADMLANLQAVAAGSGIVVLEVGDPKKVAETLTPPPGGSRQGTPNGVAPAATLERWDMFVKVRGTYPQVRTFVRDLERALLLSDIQFMDVVAVTSEASGVSSGTLDAKMTIRTYVQITPK